MKLLFGLVKFLEVRYQGIVETSLNGGDKPFWAVINASL
jgi:hypothetical protein